jgi:alpha-L-fucosidase
MKTDSGSRRLFLKHLGAAGAAAACSSQVAGATNIAKAQATPNASSEKQAATRAQRMAWWHKAKFGMFIHWGLYSLVGQHEWDLEVEGIPILQYEYLAKHFQPKPNAAREWAKLARRAGQKYMVMTTKHHEGFCHFDSKLTDYCGSYRKPVRGLLLLAHGLASSRWRPLQN